MDITKGHVSKDHVHLFVSIPPQVRIPLNPIIDSTAFRSLIPLIPAKMSERSDAVFC